MERDATGKTARAFYEFWNTGDEALPKEALAEKLCQLRRTAAVRAGNDWFAAQQAPRGVRKGVEMITLKMISEKFNAWRRYRDAVRELSSSLIMNCAISASAAATSKTSCAARARPERTRKATGSPNSGLFQVFRQQICSRSYRPANLLIVRSIGNGLFSTSPRNRTSPVRPPSAIATACFFLATSKATKDFGHTFPWSALRA